VGLVAVVSEHDAAVDGFALFAQTVSFVGEAVGGIAVDSLECVSSGSDVALENLAIICSSVRAWR